MIPRNPILYVFLSLVLLFEQEPPPPATPLPPSTPAEPAPKAPPVDSKGRPLPSFLIVGTVFDENALSLPGVRVRVRRIDEKRSRWETYSNSRGEFAVRVVPGYEYEVTVHMNKYQDQSEVVNSKVDVQQRLSIKLQPAEPTKTGAKP